MSWLFGMNQRPQDFSQFVPPPSATGGGGGSDDSGRPEGSGRGSGAMEAYRFDSAALERAANAAKELEKSGIVLCIRLVSVVYGIFTFLLAKVKDICQLDLKYFRQVLFLQLL